MYTHAGSLKNPTLPGLHPLWWIWSLSGANVRPQFSQGTNCAWALCQAASLNLSVYRKHTLFGVACQFKSVIVLLSKLSMFEKIG